MAVSHFTDNKFGISRFKRKKFFRRSVLLILVKNYSQRTALFDVLTILPLLVLCAVKRKLSCLFGSWGSAPPSNTETLSSEESLSYSESWSALEIPDEDPSFLSSSCGTSLPQFTVNSTLDSRLISQIIIIKNHDSRRLPKSRFTRNRKVISQFMGNNTSNSRFTKIPFTALFPLDVFISIEKVDTCWCWQRTMQPCLLFSRNCTKKAKNLS